VTTVVVEPYNSVLCVHSFLGLTDRTIVYEVDAESTTNVRELRAPPYDIALGVIRLMVMTVNN
jgi:hypothetical protein